MAPSEDEAGPAMPLPISSSAWSRRSTPGTLRAGHRNNLIQFVLNRTDD